MRVDSKKLFDLSNLCLNCGRHLSKDEVQECCMKVFGTKTLPKEVLEDLTELTDHWSEQRFVEMLKEDLVKNLKKLNKLYAGKLQGDNNAKDQS